MNPLQLRIEIGAEDKYLDQHIKRLESIRRYLAGCGSGLSLGETKLLQAAYERLDIITRP